ncbi:uncharacterized protein LOC115374521 [Myripristis murdjan]|uniref:uncharacterized protein LOC115374521 n=1 Tax=Myripristis murdjan TaxID=586833 RepID=UPI001175E678|nr:uncharacterized protein LOC115374521 [Myripristis murdjan]
MNCAWSSHGLPGKSRERLHYGGGKTSESSKLPKESTVFSPQRLYKRSQSLNMFSTEQIKTETSKQIRGAEKQARDRRDRMEKHSIRNEDKEKHLVRKESLRKQPRNKGSDKDQTKHEGSKKCQSRPDGSLLPRYEGMKKHPIINDRTERSSVRKEETEHTQPASTTQLYEVKPAINRLIADDLLLKGRAKPEKNSKEKKLEFCDAEINVSAVSNQEAVKSDKLEMGHSYDNKNNRIQADLGGTPRVLQPECISETKRNKAEQKCEETVSPISRASSGQCIGKAHKTGLLPPRTAKDIILGHKGTASQQNLNEQKQKAHMVENEAPSSDKVVLIKRSFSVDLSSQNKDRIARHFTAKAGKESACSDIDVVPITAASCAQEQQSNKPCTLSSVKHVYDEAPRCGDTSRESLKNDQMDGKYRKATPENPPLRKGAEVVLKCRTSECPESPKSPENNMCGDNLGMIGCRGSSQSLQNIKVEDKRAKHITAMAKETILDDCGAVSNNRTFATQSVQKHQQKGVQNVADTLEKDIIFSNHDVFNSCVVSGGTNFENDVDLYMPLMEATSGMPERFKVHQMISRSDEEAEREVVQISQHQDRSQDSVLEHQECKDEKQMPKMSTVSSDLPDGDWNGLENIIHSMIRGFMESQDVATQIASRVIPKIAGSVHQWISDVEETKRNSLENVSDPMQSNPSCDATYNQQNIWSDISDASTDNPVDVKQTAGVEIVKDSAERNGPTPYQLREPVNFEQITVGHPMIANSATTQDYLALKSSSSDKEMLMRPLHVQDSCGSTSSVQQKVRDHQAMIDQETPNNIRAASSAMCEVKVKSTQVQMLGACSADFMQEFNVEKDDPLTRNDSDDLVFNESYFDEPLVTKTAKSRSDPGLMDALGNRKNDKGHSALQDQAALSYTITADARNSNKQVIPESPRNFPRSQSHQEMIQKGPKDTRLKLHKASKARSHSVGKSSEKVKKQLEMIANEIEVMIVPELTMTGFPVCGRQEGMEVDLMTDESPGLNNEAPEQETVASFVEMDSCEEANLLVENEAAEEEQPIAQEQKVEIPPVVAGVKKRSGLKRFSLDKDNTDCKIS